MKIGDVESFCNCLLNNLKDHVTGEDDEGRCVYCRHAVVHRAVTEVDMRCEDTHGEKLHKIKMERLELLIERKKHHKRLQ